MTTAPEHSGFPPSSTSSLLRSQALQQEAWLGYLDSLKESARCLMRLAEAELALSAEYFSSRFPAQPEPSLLTAQLTVMNYHAERAFNYIREGIETLERANPTEAHDQHHEIRRYAHCGAMALYRHHKQSRQAPSANTSLFWAFLVCDEGRVFWDGMDAELIESENPQVRMACYHERLEAEFSAIPA